MRHPLHLASRLTRRVCPRRRYPFAYRANGPTTRTKRRPVFHDLLLSRLWSREKSPHETGCDYAECVGANPILCRQVRTGLDIIRHSTLWVLCRTRDDTHPATERLRTSRSIRSSAFSLRSRFSSAMSSTERPLVPSCSPRSLANQLPSVPSLIPRSRATCAIGFPVSRTIRTAPSRNSWSYFLRFSDMTTPHSACLHGFGGGSITLDRPDSPRVARALQLLTEELNAPTVMPTDPRPLTYQLAQA